MPSHIEQKHYLQTAFKTALTGGVFIDTKFYAFSRRRSSGVVDKPLAVYANSSILRAASPYFEGLLARGFEEGKVANIDEDFPSDREALTEDYEYDSDSDLEDEEDLAEQLDLSKVSFLPPMKKHVRGEEEFGLDTLKQICSKEIQTQLKPQNAVPELFSEFTSRYPEIRDFELTYICNNSRDPVIIDTLPAWIEAVTNAPAYGPHVEGLDHVQVLERTFDEREDQRQATSVRDIEMRTTFVSQVKSYLQQAGEQRHTQFRRLKSHIDQHVTSTQKRLKNILGALAGAYIKAELHRDRVFADSEAHMRFVFDDMMSLMEEQSGALEVVQNQHINGCYDEVESLLAAMRVIVQQISPSFPGDHEPQPSPSIVQSVAPEAAPSRPPTSGPGELMFESTSSTRRYPWHDPFSAHVLLQGNIFSNELPIPPRLSVAPRQGNIISKTHPIPPQIGIPSRQTDAARAVSYRYHKMFTGHSARFERAQRRRNVQFVTQLHQLHQEIAVLDMQAQMTFKEQQKRFDDELGIAWLTHARKFRTFLQSAERQLGRAESASQDAFYEKQTSRNARFENAQQTRRATFKQRYNDMQGYAVKAEGKRAKKFLAWKEQKMYEMERHVYEWQTDFARDERERKKRMKRFV
ncbi:hypothetical protein EUX98_g8130 [Antrodiella citrinella]|uniref:BTB domain-containing protein n=1 Tax=Antrodiella citrinella TaxID=2447956 RepID=A0A4S4MIP9_9APHY|nr:hypothetical protein EUX98_g8130 [Antrodiella citrinella]